VAGILLIHGALHGPWCWTEFAQRLAAQGHDACAVDLRPHKKTWRRLDGYVAEAARAAEAFATPPVVVGHSLGGLVVQKYLERHAAPGGVLMASVLPGGGVGAVARQWLRHPWPMFEAGLSRRFRPLVATPALVRAHFFTPETPQAIVDRCFAQIEDDSPFALFATLAERPRPDRVRAPVLVLGAARDAMISAAATRRTARAYRAEAEIFQRIGHDMMLDRGWEKVADRIAAWAGERA
jgi:pimeloyl-ACP methyl ester carboxylesterase